MELVAFDRNLDGLMVEFLQVGLGDREVFQQERTECRNASRLENSIMLEKSE